MRCVDALDVVTEQRDEAREALKTGGMLNIIDRAHHERAAAIRERDEARAENIGWQNKWQVAVEMAALAQNELVTEQRDEAVNNYETSQLLSIRVGEQRDRLAEAVNAATILIAAKGRHNTMLAYNGLRDALQSLTPNASVEALTKPL
jgi:hypothetical protein